MSINPLAGKPAPKELLVDLDTLRNTYYTRQPDILDSAQRVSFGTSGHPAESFRGSEHLRRIQEEAQALLSRVLARGAT